MKFLLIIMATICFTNLTLAGEGTVGNGGSTYEQANQYIFLTWAKDILKDFEEWAGKSLSIDPKLLKKAVYSTSYKATEKQLFDKNGVPVDATNDPKSKTIIINVTAFNKIKDVASSKAFLLHELLGIMQIDDKNYVLSGKYLNELVPRIKEELKTKLYNERYTMLLPGLDIHTTLNNEVIAIEKMVNTLSKTIINSLINFNRASYSSIWSPSYSFGEFSFYNRVPYNSDNTDFKLTEATFNKVINLSTIIVKAEYGNIVVAVLHQILSELAAKGFLKEFDTELIQGPSDGQLYLKVKITYFVWKK